MAGSGRKIKVPNGGSIEFAEDSTLGTNKGTLKVTNLTSDVVYTLPNKSCNLGGLGPGETYPVSSGGTGLSSISLGRIPYGSNGETMLLSPAPTTENTFFGWDGFTLRYSPITIGPNGEVNTLASTGTGARVNRSKLGSEIQLRSLKSGNAMTITQGQDEIVFDVNFSAFTGTIQPAQGGTGISSITQGDLLVGAAGNTYGKLAKPGNGLRVLRSNQQNTAYEWADPRTFDSGLTDVWSGQIDLPDPSITYSIHTYVPYRFRLSQITHGFKAGTSANVTVKVGSATPVGNVALGTGGTDVTTAIDTSVIYDAGSKVTITFSNSNLAEGYRFSLVYIRAIAGEQ
jgi:hypothetical protein